MKFKSFRKFEGKDPQLAINLCVFCAIIDKFVLQPQEDNNNLVEILTPNSQSQNGSLLKILEKMASDISHIKKTNRDEIEKWMESSKDVKI